MGIEDKVPGSVLSIQEIVTLEAQTLAAEINLLGRLRDRMAPAARYGQQIPIKYRRLRYQTESEVEQWEYLPEGFPSLDNGKPVSTLVVLDKYVTEEVQSATPESGSRLGHYVGEQLYLTKDKKWVVAERVGVYSEEVGSSSQWDAKCTVVSDRLLLERFSLETVSEGIFAATSKVWEGISPRLEALKKRADRVAQISDVMAKLKDGPPEGTPPAEEPIKETPTRR